MNILEDLKDKRFNSVPQFGGTERKEADVKMAAEGYFISAFCCI